MQPARTRCCWGVGGRWGHGCQFCRASQLNDQRLSVIGSRSRNTHKTARDGAGGLSVSLVGSGCGHTEGPTPLWKHFQIHIEKPTSQPCANMVLPTGKLFCREPNVNASGVPACGQTRRQVRETVMGPACPAGAEPAPQGKAGGSICGA